MPQIRTPSIHRESHPDSIVRFDPLDDLAERLKEAQEAEAKLAQIATIAGFC
jgi:hypothetical protein